MIMKSFVETVKRKSTHQSWRKSRGSTHLVAGCKVEVENVLKSWHHAQQNLTGNRKANNTQ